MKEEVVFVQVLIQNDKFNFDLNTSNSVSICTDQIFSCQNNICKWFILANFQTNFLGRRIFIIQLLLILDPFRHFIFTAHMSHDQRSEFLQMRFQIMYMLLKSWLIDKLPDLLELLFATKKLYSILFQYISIRLQIYFQSKTSFPFSLYYEWISEVSCYTVLQNSHLKREISSSTFWPWLRGKFKW